jgi:triacylglycerol lipase
MSDLTAPQEGKSSAMRGPLRALSTVAATLQPRVAATILRELAGVGIAVAAYPLGLLDEAFEAAPMRSHPLPPARNPRYHLNPAAYDVPVILVHGYAHNRSGYWLLKHRLRKIGFRNVHTLNYNPWLLDIPGVAARLRRRVELVCGATGQDYVHIVGHSMGGIVTRYYVQKLGGDSRVLHAITIGSPHNGTLAASAMSMLGRTARQLGWGSRLIRELNTSPPGTHVRWTSIYSSSDELVIPAESARLCPSVFDSRNIHVPGEGHMSLLVSTRVMGIVIDCLTEIDNHPHLASFGSNADHAAFGVVPSTCARSPKAAPATR